MNDSPRSVPDWPRSVPDWIGALVTAARAADGAPPFSDQALVDYRTGARELVAIDESAAALVTTPEAAEEQSDASREAEFVVHPDARNRGIGTRLLETLLGSTLGSTPDPMLFWAHGDHPAARALAASHGLTPMRELLHLTGPVPDRELPGSAAISAFRVGVDEDEWVALNHRTFAHHAEQGSVTRADLEQLESEAWFRADDFLILRDGATGEGGAMIGYCWVKIEPDAQENDGSGEIYVLGVSPDRQGEKLGGLLLEAGLARMRARGIDKADLYVEGDNASALSLYRSRGFTQDSIDIQYISHQTLRG
ncbi:MAG: mycothiol synthase [Actinomycetota bacterium]|nr:mycothiol synthase [Actinomycetota bacterium]